MRSVLLCIAVLSGAAGPARARGIEANGTMLNSRTGRDLGSGLRCMAEGPLTDEALAANEPLKAALADNPPLVGLVEYMVQCALPEGSAVIVDVAGEPTELEGSGGLAPEWLDGPCDDACQEWVSACLYARTNFYGLPVVISMRADHASASAHPSVEEAEQFAVEEAAFYGNFFTEPPEQYACRGQGWDPWLSTFRVCSRPGSPCGIQAVGPCGPIDGLTGEPSTRHACEGQTGEGAWTRCHDVPSLPGEDTFPERGRTWRRVVTIYLQRGRHHAEPDLDACVDPPGAADVPAPAVLSDDVVVGRPCRTNEDCGDTDLTCDVRTFSGICTAGCEPSDNPVVEQVRCGDLEGATCLTRGTGTPGACTRACTPTGAASEGPRCHPGQACTMWWWLRDDLEPAGCAPFCSEDAHCPPGSWCNTRQGSCWGLTNPGGLADGEPCDPRVIGPGGRSAECRGACLRVSDDPDRGICGSLVDLGTGARCPDDPDTMPPIGPQPRDDIAFCVFRRCETDDDCSAPLRCGPNPLDGARSCTLR